VREKREERVRRDGEGEREESKREDRVRDEEGKIEEEKRGL